jgi:hypothetical protein
MAQRQNGLQVGDAVSWTDPDTGLPGTFFIQEILTDLGFIEGPEDLVIISDNDAACHEVFVSELL